MSPSSVIAEGIPRPVIEAQAQSGDDEPKDGNIGLSQTHSSVLELDATKVSHDSQAEPDSFILTERNSEEATGFAFSTWKKWRTLSIIFLVQTSMNFNTSLYASGQKGIMREFGVSEAGAVSGAAVFLITYAFGCELWAPWSEEFGRKPVLQTSLFLVNICCIPVALAPNGFTSIVVGRAFGGLFSAGGSVTLGMVADMFKADEQEYPLAFIVLSSVGGSIIGPIIGSFVETYLDWHWTIWIQLIFGAFVQLLHLFAVPETRSTVLLDRRAKELRKSGERSNACGPNEGKTWREYLVPKELFSVWIRPFRMFVTEPIVSVLSALSGFSDALIFMQIQSFGRAFGLWNFSTVEIGLAFLPIGLAYLLTYLLFVPVISRNRNMRVKNRHSEHAQFEARMWCLLYMAPCLPIGLLIFAWTSTPQVHWIAPMFGCVFIGIANYAIYMATIDYMVAAYGPYSASATGGNGFARDLLAGILTWLASPYYNAFQGEYGLQTANTILAGISLILVAATFVIYFKGPSMRKRSPFAQSISQTVDDDQVALPPTAVT